MLFDDDPCGTAFAVRCPSKRMLITAGHNVVQNNVVVGDGNSFSICRRTERNDDGTIVITGKQDVTVIEFDATADWAVLAINEIPFNDNEMLTICPFDEIEPTINEPYYKIYHCPCEDFNSGILNVLELCAMPWMKTCGFARLQGTLSFYVGLSKGSSGGCVIDKTNGRAVAFHVESDSSVLTVQEAKAKSVEKTGTEYEKALPDMTDVFESISQAIDSSAHNHNSISKCVIISKYADLIRCLGLDPNDYIHNEPSSSVTSKKVKRR